MQIIAADIEDVKIIEPQIFKEDRGYFLESYHLNRFKNVPIFTFSVCEPTIPLQSTFLFKQIKVYCCGSGQDAPE